MTRYPSDRTRGVHVHRGTSAVPSLVSGEVVNQAMASCWYAKDAPYDSDHTASRRIMLRRVPQVRVLASCLSFVS
jgi:hypothetical protein